MELPPELFLKNYPPGEEGSSQDSSERNTSREERPVQFNRPYAPSAEESPQIHRYSGDEASQGTGRTNAASTASTPEEAPVPPASQEPPKKKTSYTPFFAAAVIFALLILFFGMVRSASSGGEGTKNLQSASLSSEPDAKAYVKQAKERLNASDYNGALKAIVACYELQPDSKVREECDALYAQLSKAVRNNEPDNGETMDRTFQYYGGCVLRATAENGPTLITISAKNDPAAYASFYVRSGQTAEINVPGGTYRIEYQIGKLWLNNEIGFGDVCENVSFDKDFVFKSETVAGWVFNDTVEITV